MSTHALSIDPGAAHTGIVLARLDNGKPTPIDGCTLDRLPSEKPEKHMGLPRWARRVVATAKDLCAKHGATEDALIVCVETLLPPNPRRNERTGGKFTPMKIWRGWGEANIVLGACVQAWSQAVLVAPDGHDHRSNVPDVLRGRKPKGWAESSSRREHQRAAWSVLMAGLELRARHPGAARRLDAERPGGDLADSVAAEVRASGDLSLKAVVAATKRSLGSSASHSGIAQVAARAATRLDPSLDVADVETAVQRALRAASAA